MKNKVSVSICIVMALTLAACAPQAAPAAEPATASAAQPTIAQPATDVPATSTGKYGYGDDNTYATSTVAPSGVATAAPASAVATVSVAQKDGIGSYLVDASGKALYLYTSDSATASACSGGCASNWPPVTVSGNPVAGAGLNAALLTTLPRGDGSLQVVYNGHPLYTFGGDSGPGDVNGQGKGGSWYLLSPAGAPIQ